VKRRREAGFAFLDAVIAAAVIAGTVGVMYRVVADGTARTRAVTVKRLAVMVAESRLATVGTEIPLSAGTVTGLEGPFIWRLQVTPYSVGPGRSEAGELYRVAVTVRYRTADGNAVEIRSLRLAPPV
jgi:hypothetical protein